MSEWFTAICHLYSTLDKGSKSDKLAVDDAKAKLVQSFGQRLQFDSMPEIVFDPGKDIAVPTLQVNHSVKTDKAMEIWAQVQCGVIKVYIYICNV